MLITVQNYLLNFNLYLTWRMEQFLICNWLSLGCFGVCLTNKMLTYQGFQPEDSNSKVLGNEGDLIIDDTTNSISSVLRKEKGKWVIPNPSNPGLIADGKDSLGESFVDTKRRPSFSHINWNPQ